MSRLACLVLTAPLLGGCGALLGIEDPVAEFPVSPAIGGHYLLQLVDQDGFFIDFHVEVGVTPSAREVYTRWQALDGTDGTPADPRSPNGAAFDAANIILTNTEEFEFEPIEFDVAYLGTGGEDVQLDAELSGRFPILAADDEATTDGFCGEVEGAYLSPVEGRVLQGTYAAFRIEDVAIDADVPGQLVAINTCDMLINR